VGNVRLFFDVDGAALTPDGAAMRQRPTLLLLHGGPGFDHSGFKPHFSPLAAAAQVVFLDHRGNGRSDAGQPADWTLARWADDVREFCDALEIDRPYVYGVSFGGMVAQAYATRHPEHPAGLILDSTGPRVRLDLSFEVFERLGGMRARTVAERFWADTSNAAAWDEYLAVCYPLYTRVPQDPNGTRRTLLRRNVLEHFFRPGGEGHHFDMRAELARVRCPVLVLSGQEDPMTPPALAAELEASLPRHLVRVERIAGAGHGLFRDRPDAILPLIRDFMT